MYLHSRIDLNMITAILAVDKTLFVNPLPITSLVYPRPISAATSIWFTVAIYIYILGTRSVLCIHTYINVRESIAYI
jgi:hypothetical protein